MLGNTHRHTNTGGTASLGAPAGKTPSSIHQSSAIQDRTHKQPLSILVRTLGDIIQSTCAPFLTFTSRGPMSCHTHSHTETELTSQKVGDVSPPAEMKRYDDET